MKIYNVLCIYNNADYWRYFVHLVQILTHAKNMANDFIKAFQIYDMKSVIGDVRYNQVTVQWCHQLIRV